MGRLEKLPTLMYANGRGIKLAIYLFLMAETALIGGRCWDLHLISSRVEQSEVRVHSDTAAAVVWDHSNGGWDHFPSRHGLCSQARLCCAVSNVAAWVPVPVPPGVCGITRRLGVAGFVAKHTPALVRSSQPSSFSLLCSWKFYYLSRTMGTGETYIYIVLLKYAKSKTETDDLPPLFSNWRRKRRNVFLVFYSIVAQ